MQHQSCVLVTGGGQRIGRHCALRLRACHYRVLVSYRTWRDDFDELEQQGIELIHAELDTAEGILGLAEAVRARTSHLRALIHNASQWLANATSTEQQLEDFTLLVNLHMLTPYLLNQSLAPLLEAGADPFADIIHMSDYIVHKGSSRHTAYAASKAGLENLSRSFAKLLAPTIKVNAIAPSLIMFQPDDDPDYRARTLKKSAIGIEPGPEVIYQTVRFLLDNPYITGAVIPVDGGRAIV